MAHWQAWVDGASRGNPGVAGIGALIVNEDGETVKEIAEPLGITTNNVAEYSALIRALEEARLAGCNRIEVFTDSQLMACQINGVYAVKKPHLYHYYKRATALLGAMEHWKVQYIPREENRRADALSNLGADKAGKGG